MRFNIGRLLAAIAAAVALSMSAHVVAADEAPVAAAGEAPVEIDADAAETLARREDCLKCHGVEKSKEGPSFKKIAAKFKTKPDAPERVLKHIKSGDIVTLDNGDEEEHKVIKTTDEKALQNLIRWILSR